MSSRAKNKYPFFFIGLQWESLRKHGTGLVTSVTSHIRKNPSPCLSLRVCATSQVPFTTYDLSNTVPRTSVLPTHDNSNVVQCGHPTRLHEKIHTPSLLLVLTEWLVLEGNCGQDNLIVR